MHLTIPVETFLAVQVRTAEHPVEIAPPLRVETDFASELGLLKPRLFHLCVQLHQQGDQLVYGAEFPSSAGIWGGVSVSERV